MASTICATNAAAATASAARGRSGDARRPRRSRPESARRSGSWRRPTWVCRRRSESRRPPPRRRGETRPRRRTPAPSHIRVNAGTNARTTRYTPRNHSSATHSRPSPAADSAPRVMRADDQTDRPCRQVPEHRPTQPLRPGEKPCAPRRAGAPAIRARCPAREEEQWHDLNDPRDRGDRGQLAEQVADVQTVGVDGGEQQRAVPEHDDHEGGEPGDVHGAVATGRGVAGDLACVGHRLGERHVVSMPGRGPLRMSSTTRPPDGRLKGVNLQRNLTN